MPELKLYYMKPCPFCKKVIKFIEEENIEDVQLMDVFKTENMDELIKVGGKEQVPCLFVDGKPMYESDDIINYLKENIAK
ncbi:MAG: glutaredoxin [Tissierellia bacterium]|nr:glutaredoxin [Tissierellia bacterium]